MGEFLTVTAWATGSLLAVRLLLWAVLTMAGRAMDRKRKVPHE